MSINDLLTLLDEPQVKEKIKSFISELNKQATADYQDQGIESSTFDNEQIKELNKKNTDLREENKTVKEGKDEMFKIIQQLKDSLFSKNNNISANETKIAVLEDDLSTLKSILKNKEDEAKQEVQTRNDFKIKFDKLQAKIDWYREHFSEDIQIQDIYNNLSELTKTSLSGIFKSTSTSGLIVCGVQDKNISNLWDYAKSEVINGNNPDIDKIILLFNALFARFTLAFPMYELQHLAVGEQFDIQQHIKHNSSVNVSGSIKSVLLYGYLNIKTGKTIKQSIVII
ncbi:MAG: hypothetical protein JJV99_11770 [Colwellia sp.]|nr:hypothetical protein [Colwellia sp.]